jgi:flagellar biosynthesis/type III secretory pathway M-ring protein FliF/YscJ
MAHQRKSGSVRRQKSDERAKDSAQQKAELAQVYERVRKKVDEQPKKAASVLSDWLNDERASRRAKTSTRDKKKT